MAKAVPHLNNPQRPQRSQMIISMYEFKKIIVEEKIKFGVAKKTSFSDKKCQTSICEFNNGGYVILLWEESNLKAFKKSDRNISKVTVTIEPIVNHRYYSYKGVLFWGEDEEEQEFQELLRFFWKLNLPDSYSVSKYIIEHNLGEKFKHISGYVRFENESDSWELPGGISPKYYAKLCLSLGLRNQNSDSRVVGFENFEQRGFEGVFEDVF